MARTRVLFFAFLMFACMSGVHAHALLHQTLSGEAVVVRLQFAGTDERPWFEAYELFAPDGDTVYQRGFVNADGEVSFVPNRAGRWRLQVFTEDGHGATVLIQTGAEPVANQTPSVAPGFLQRVMLALGLLFGFFGMLALAWTRTQRRKRPR